MLTGARAFVARPNWLRSLGCILAAAAAGYNLLCLAVDSARARRTAAHYDDNERFRSAEYDDDD